MNTERWSRRLWAAAFISNAAWIGFIATLMVAASVLEAGDPDRRASLLFYALGGALFATVAASVFSTVVRPRLLRPATIVALLIAAGLAIYVISV
jgi:hypothetical protein